MYLSWTCTSCDVSGSAWNASSSDVQRVGGKYPDAWHYEHMRDPRSTSPGSIMPAYAWLEKNPADATTIQNHMKALRTAGVPYTDEEIAKAPADLKGKTEMDALVAYLQSLGTALK